MILGSEVVFPNTLLGASLGAVWNGEGVLSAPPKMFVDAAGLVVLAPNVIEEEPNIDGVVEGAAPPNVPNGDAPVPSLLELPNANVEGEVVGAAAGKAEVPKTLLLAGCVSFAAAKGLSTGEEEAGLKSKIVGLGPFAVAGEVGFLGAPNPANEVGGAGGVSLLEEDSVGLDFALAEDSSYSFWILERRD